MCLPFTSPPLPRHPLPPLAPQWPPLLRPVSPVMRELPGLVQAKYRACQTMCFCGVLPSIRRAWASVDKSLFLWRYDRR
jgi:nuclear pore complex protein Nup155